MTEEKLLNLLHKIIVVNRTDTELKGNADLCKRLIETKGEEYFLKIPNELIEKGNFKIAFENAQLSESVTADKKTP